MLFNEKNEDEVYHDTILNLIEIETTIRLFWQNTKRNIKTDCFSSDNLIYRDNMYIIAIIYFDTEIKNDKSAKKIKLDVFKNNEWIQLKVDKGII